MVTINKEFALGANEGSSQVANRLYIILHDVGAESGARANAAYFKNNIAAEVAYTAFVVGDGGKVYQVGEPGYVQWGAGTVANANSPVQIELGHTSDPKTFKKDYAAYIELARDMAAQYGIPTSLDAGGAGTPGIKSHLWVTQHIWGNHTDPYGYLSHWGITKEKLAADLANGGTSTPTAAPTQKPAASNIPSGFTAENGTFVNGDTKIMNRVGSPSTTAQQGGYLPAYGEWPYDSWAKVGNYTWIHHMFENKHIYLPVREWPSGNAWGAFK